MDLIKCPWCEMTISDENERCPLCRRPLNAKPSEIAFFHAAQRKDEDYRAARRAEQDELEEREARRLDASDAGEDDELDELDYSGPTEYCRFCGEEIPRRARVCPLCDSRLRYPALLKCLLLAAFFVFAYYLGGR